MEGRVQTLKDSVREDVEENPLKWKMREAEPVGISRFPIMHLCCGLPCPTDVGHSFWPMGCWRT